MSATGRPGVGDGDSGQTMLEMLVVIGILGLVVGLLFPAMIAPLQRAEFNRSRSALVEDLRRARAVAVRGGAPVALSLSNDGRGYWWNGVPVVLPLQSRIGGDPSVVFYGDGSSTGGSLAIASATRRGSVRVSAAGIATAS